MQPSIGHGVIATQDDVVEVLSQYEPVWEQAEPAIHGDIRAGKAHHMYTGEDDEEIERVSAELDARKKRKRPE